MTAAGSSPARLAAVLVFIGVKLVLHFAHEHRPGVPEISTGLSLAVIAAVLATATLASLAAARRDPGLRARAGSLRGHEGREFDHGR